MYVHVLKEKSVVVDKINSRTWPAGWKGDVHADILATWSEGEDFILIDVPGEILAAGGKPADKLTAEEVDVLKTAAGQAIAHAHDLVASGDLGTDGDDE